MRSTSFNSVRQSAAQSSAITTDVTLDALDVGATILVQADGVTVTLPAVATGLYYTIEVDGDGYGVTVEPNDADNIAGFGVTGTNGDLWVCTSSTAQKGDRLKLAYMNADGYVVTEEIGTWTQASD